MKNPMNLRLHESIELLRFLTPPAGLMHVGIGLGNDAKRYVDWNLDGVVLFDADKNSTDRMAAAHSGQGWQVLNKYISDASVDKDFYVASKASESGAINPDQLKVLWKNISTREIRKVKSTTIDAELPTLKVPQSINWLVVDCLPALPVLSGANRLLEQCDVVIVRLLLDGSALEIPGAGRAEVEAGLTANGFRLVGFEEELQPDIAQALFVRDWKRVYDAKIEALSTENLATLADQAALLSSWQIKCQEQAKLADERQVMVDRLIVRRDELVNQHNQSSESIKRFTAAQEAAQAKMAEQQKQLSELQGKYQEQSKLADERLGTADRLVKARDDFAKQAQDYAEQVKKLTSDYETVQAQMADLQKKLSESQAKHQEQARLADERQVMADRLVKVRDEFARQAQEYAAQAKNLTSDHATAQTKIAELQKQLSDLNGKHQALARLADERQVMVDRLVKVRDEFAKQSQENAEQAKKLKVDYEAAYTKVHDLQKLVSELQDKQREQTRLAEDRLELSDRLAKANDEHAKVLAERQNQIQQMQQVSEQQIKLAAERQTQMLQAQKTADEQTKLASERQQLVDNLVKVRDSHAKLAAERLAQIEQLQKDNAEQVNQTATFQQRFEQAASDIAELKRDLTDGRQTMAINTRLLALREADLRDLQNKYQASVSIQESQHQMLVKLGERLSTASRYFHQLADQQVKLPAGGHGLSIEGNAGKSKALAKPKAEMISKAAVRPPTKLKSDSGKKTRIPAKNKSNAVKKTSVKKTSVKKTSKQRSGGY